MQNHRLRIVLSLLSAALLLACGGGVPEGPPQAVFLITIDTLRADHLSYDGYPRTTSPFIDELAANGLVFERAFSSVSHTAPSHASLFTGLHPAQHGLLRNGEDLHESLLTLPQVFQEQGYETGGFTTVSFLRSLHPGFSEFQFNERFFPAETIFDSALGFLRRQERGEKVFLWIHLFDVHQWNREDHVDQAAREEMLAASPLDRKAMRAFLAERGADFERFPPRKILDAIDAYDGQILSTDRQIKRFYDAAGAEGWNQDALWIITADHGEGLGSHAYMGHGRNLYDEQTRVPLVMHSTAGRFTPRRIDGITELVDIPPTLTEMLGTSMDAQRLPIAGTSLASAMNDPAVSWPRRSAFSQRRPIDEKRRGEGWEEGEVVSLRTGQYKVIVRSEGVNEIYDLGADPHELKDLMEDPPPDEERLRDRLLQRWAEMITQGEEIGSTEINPEYIEELKALGYL